MLGWAEAACDASVCCVASCGLWPRAWWPGASSAVGAQGWAVNSDDPGLISGKLKRETAGQGADTANATGGTTVWVTAIDSWTFFDSSCCSTDEHPHWLPNNVRLGGQHRRRRGCLI